mgnify:CR=1 FL=1
MCFVSSCPLEQDGQRGETFICLLEVFFVERYIAGLRPEIRTAAILHQLEDVDTASCLALLHEVELDNDKACNSSKFS